jgi:hypothetical protein
MSDLLGQGPEVGEALLASTAWVFAYVDRICNQLVVEYASAQREWARTPNAIRSDAVRRILSGSLVYDVEAARLLGHELRRRHHIGLVIWTDATNHQADQLVRQTVAAAADALGVGDPIVVHPSDAELWAWFSVLEEPRDVPSDPLAGVLPPVGVRVAAGRLRMGIEGFRHSHIEARAAARVALLAGARARRDELRQRRARVAPVRRPRAGPGTRAG